MCEADSVCRHSLSKNDSPPLRSAWGVRQLWHRQGVWAGQMLSAWWHGAFEWAKVYFQVI